MNYKFSIIIPTYECKGRGVEFLDVLLNSIKSQSYKNYEVIISDHSIDSEIKDFCVSNKYDLPIVYLKNNIGIGNSSINMNNGIKNCSGDFIKIMHIDDYFCNNNCLELINLKLNESEKNKWGGVSFNHFYEKENSTRREMTPDINSVFGCPSVSFFANENNYFDENLIVVNDYDMHNRLFKKYGNPAVINEVCITIRMHGGQVSNFSGILEIEQKEREYLNQKNK